MLDRSALRMKSLNCFSDEIFLTSDESFFHSLGPYSKGTECFPKVTMSRKSGENIGVIINKIR